jgi:hypothetical protein
MRKTEKGGNMANKPGGNENENSRLELAWLEQLSPQPLRTEQLVASNELISSLTQKIILAFGQEHLADLRISADQWQHDTPQQRIKKLNALFAEHPNLKEDYDYYFLRWGCLLALELMPKTHWP